MPEPRKSVLVLDGEQRSSLAVVRALGEKNISIIVGSETGNSLAGSSKCCILQEKYSSPLVTLPGFLEDLQRIIRLHTIDIIIPCTDIASSAVLHGKAALQGGVSIMAPPPEQYFNASDKIALIDRSLRLGIPCPESTVVCCLGDWQHLAITQEFPVIFKPKASVIIKDDTLFTTAVKIVQTYEEGADLIRNDPGFSIPFLVQQKITGQGVGVFALFDNGRPVTFFSHRRLREKPPWGGVSVLCESAESAPQVLEYASKILTDLKYHGVAMVEFKRDNETCVPYLMEINARFWGSLQLAVSAGVNFPLLFYRLTSGKAVSQVQLGGAARLRWLLGDLDSLMISLRGTGPFDRNSMPSKSQILQDFLAEFFRKTSYQVFRWSDLSPFLLELRVYLKALVGR